MFYAQPPAGTTVSWKPGQLTTFVRFTSESVALLHYSSQLFVARDWLHEPVHVGLSAAIPGLPVLVVQVGEEGLSVAAPACLFEVMDAALAEAWLDNPPASTLALVLLEPGPAAGQAHVRAVRTVPHAGVVLQALRRQLRIQYEDYSWEEAGSVQAAGRQLLLDNKPDTFLLDADPLLRITE